MAQLHTYQRLRRNRRLMILILCSVVGLVMYFFFSYYTAHNAREIKTDSTPKVQSKADMAIEGIHQVSTRDGRTEWVLDADSAEMMDAEGKLRLKNVSMIFYLEDGKEVHITADQGQVDTETNDIEVMGNVVATHGIYQFLGEYLGYEKKAHSLTSDQKVNVIAGASTLTADAMRVDLNSEQAVFTGNIAGDFYEVFNE